MMMFHIAGGVLSKSGPIFGATLIGMAYAADPQAVAPLADWLHVKPTILQGAIFGALIFALVGEGGRLDRLRRAIAGGVFSYQGTEGLIELVQWWFKLAWEPTPGGERLASMVLAILGVIVIEAGLIGARRLRDRSANFADKAIDKLGGGP